MAQIKVKKAGLTKKAQALLDAFDEAAQDWGWQMDQGTTNVEASKEDHKNTKEALGKYILRLEKMNKFLRKQFKEKAEKEFEE